MYWNKTVAALALAGASALASSVVLADPYHHHHRHGTRFGLYIGAPAWNPGYYRYPPAYEYYYPPTRVITVPAAPTIYVERTPPPVYIERDTYRDDFGASSSGWWYYCGSSRSYYPYVRDCREGWQRVAPRPPSS